MLKEIGLVVVMCLLMAHPGTAFTVCKTTDTGTDYIGTVAVTSSGVPCVRWTSVLLSLRFSNSSYSNGLEAGASNYCRNPNGDPKGPWCYTNSLLGLKGYCNIPKCSSDVIAFFNDVVQLLLTDFNTSVNKVLSVVMTTIDDLHQKAQNLVATTPGLSPLIQLLGGNVKNAQAPPLQFNCDPQYFGPSASKPTDVDHVMIGDIKIIGGLGDSVTAGVGTLNSNFLTAATLQGRGYVSKVGGAGTVDAGNTTVSTIMRDLFKNTALKGYSTLNALGTADCGQFDIDCANLNVADMLAFHPSYIIQAIELVRRIKFDAQYKYDDWKIINIFYGPNDLCLLCQAIHFSNDIMFGLDIRIAIRILQIFLPNTFLYLHRPYDLRHLPDLQTKNLACAAIQGVLCPCVGPAGPVLSLGSNVKLNQLLINQVYDNIVSDSSFTSKGTNFYISVIKHLTNAEPPMVNGQYQTEIMAADCLHPSRAAHYIHARYVINEMLTRPSDRPLDGDYTVNGNTPIVLNCPTADHPYLRTDNN